MPLEQAVCGLSDFMSRVAPDQAVVLTSPSIAVRASAALPYPLIHELPITGLTRPWLLVVGGGALIDKTKLWRRDTQAAVRIAAAASLWGSGAEASPVAIGPGDPKRIEMGDDLLPDLRVRWPELGVTVGADAARWACGDVWSHALEAFFSPLASVGLQVELAKLIHALLQLQPIFDPTWFDLGARACSLQAQASVGLVHGIAHVIEPALLNTEVADLARHARLCATLLLPVLGFNLSQSAKAGDRLACHNIGVPALLHAAQGLHSPADFTRIAPFIRARWPQVLRDPCTRTNVALVRRDALDTILARAQTA